MDSGIGIGGLSTGKEEFVTSSFDLFTPIEVENSILKAYNLTYRPISSTSGAGPFNFEVPADPEKFTDTESIRLHGAIRIRKKNSSGALVNLAADEKVSTVNNIFDSLWEKINTKLNGVEITDPGAKWYAYKAYLENHLSYSSSSKGITLPSKGYIKDTAGKFDSVGVIGVGSSSGKPAVIAKDSENSGFNKRKELFAESKWVYFCINIHIDICTIRRYIPPGVKIELEFQRNKDNFCLLSADENTEYSIEIKDLKLKLNRYDASPKVKQYYDSAIQSGNKPILPIDRSLLKTYVITRGTSDLSHFNIVTGRQLPEQVFVGIVEHSSHNGSITKNPYNFQDFGLKEASLVVNGVHEPFDLYKLNKDDGDKADLYFNFLENTGVSSDDREFGISMDDYYGGSFILAFDRSTDKCNRFHRHIPDSGSMDINIKTKNPLAQSVTVIIYATYSSDIIIDDNKIISTII